MSEQAQWFDWVFLVVFISAWLGVLLLGERFLGLSAKKRAVISLLFMAAMFTWVGIHHL